MRIETTLLFSMSLQVAHEHVLGQTPSGVRRLYFGISGRFSGPHLHGRLVDGSDWLLVRDDEVVVQDVGILLETDDGARIAYRHRGLRHALTLGPLGAGAPATPYFLTTPVFETSDERYDWLNRIVCLGRGHKRDLQVDYAVYAVGAPTPD